MPSSPFLEYLFIYLLLVVLGLRCCGGFFSSSDERGLLPSCDAKASHCGGFSCFRAQALGCLDYSDCGSRALGRRLGSCGTWASLLRGMWDLPGSGIKPPSPALAGGYFTTETPEKPLIFIFIYFVWLLWVLVAAHVIFSCGMTSSPIGD